MRGLSKTFAICKAVAAYNMVYVHGVTVIAREIPSINFATWKFLDLSIFRGFASLCLPLFAGFFIRHEVAPYIVGNRLPFRFFTRGLDFFMLVVAIEAIRLISVTLTPMFAFNWHALHFISLSMLIVYGLLFIDQRLLYIFTALVFILRPYLESSFPDPYPLILKASAEVYQGAAVLWALTVSALVVWFLFKSYPKRKAALLSWTVALAIGVFSYHYILPRHRGLASLLNLPHSIFLPSLVDDNYWSFIVCFPIFMTGYFLKEFLFNIKFKKYLWLLNTSAVLMAVYFFAFRFRHFESKLLVKAPFSKEMFAVDHLTIMGFVSVSYLAFLGCYYYCRSRETPWLDKLTYYSRSVLMMYLVHGVIFMIFRVSFPFSLNQNWTPFQNLLFVYISIHIGYLINLYVTHRLTILFEKWKPGSVV